MVGSATALFFVVVRSYSYAFTATADPGFSLPVVRPRRVFSSSSCNSGLSAVGGSPLRTLFPRWMRHHERRRLFATSGYKEFVGNISRRASYMGFSVVVAV